MGFTALDGLPMGTRPGQLDPGVVLYLISQKGMSVQSVSDLLYRESGLKGLSGISNDVRELLASDDPRAAFASTISSIVAGSTPACSRLPRRRRCLRLHCRHRRKLRREPRPYCRTARLARRRARPCRQRSRRHADLDARQPCCALRHPHQRGTHDRATHARPGRRQRLTLDPDEDIDDLPSAKAKLRYCPPPSTFAWTSSFRRSGPTSSR